jgi:chemotaxis signal transduction protein
MRADERGPGTRADELRVAFDRSFANAPRLDTETSVDLLAIRIAGDAYALSLVEVAGLFVDRAVTPLPTNVPELLGIAGFRAALVSVYDLAALLGYSGGDPPRWMVSTVGDRAVGLVFDLFERHVRVAPSALASDDSNARRHVRQIVRTADGVRPVIHLPSVLEEITARAQSVVRPKER